MAFSKQEFWTGLLRTLAEDRPDTGIKQSLLPCRQILYRLSCRGQPGQNRTNFKLECGIQTRLRWEWIERLSQEAGADMLIESRKWRELGWINKTE